MYGKTGSILSLLQYTMTLLQGPKYPVLPTLVKAWLRSTSKIDEKYYIFLHNLT